MRFISIFLILLNYSLHSFAYQIDEPSYPGSQRDWWTDSKTRIEYEKQYKLKMKLKKQKNKENFKKFLELEMKKRNEKNE